MNKYLKVGENVKLSDDATRRICESMRAANRELAAEKAKKRRLWSCRAFKLAAVCASAALVCGAAIGAGIYFGLNGEKGDDGYNDVDIPQFYCYYMGYELEEFEQDINDFELNLYYGFDEQAVRGRYNQVLEEAKEKGYGEVLKYEIILEAKTYLRDEDGHADRVILDRLEISDIEKFPFDDYRVNVVEKDGVVIERTYAHSEIIKIPGELFVECDFQNAVMVEFHDRIEYSIGCTDYNPETDIYWSGGGKVANDRGYGIGFQAVDNCKVYFNYEISDDKIKVDKKQFEDYEYTIISYETRLPEICIGQNPCVKNNLSPIYRN